MLNSALDYYQIHQKDYLDQLKQLVKIPSVSFAGFDPQNVVKSAEYTAQLFQECGLENVEILTLPNTHPYVYADWPHAPGKPTVLLYAHHDVQPPMDENEWNSPVFEPTEKEGRLYARGAADDKAGVMIHVASLASYLKTEGKPPINVKVIIEGEEEIGSEHLPEFLNIYSKKLAADVMVLTDLVNYDTGIPSLTTSLRGMLTLRLKVTTLDHPLHSGMWGGPIPDVNQALAKILSSLTRDDGSIDIPGIYDDVQPLTPQEAKDFESLNMTETVLKKQSGMIGSTQIIDSAILHSLWRKPALSINWLKSGDPKLTGNVLMHEASARIGMRIVPRQTAAQVAKLIKNKIHQSAPWGVQVEIQEEALADPWITDTRHAYFEVAKQSLAKGYGREAVLIGCGGSVPFAGALSKALGDIPALLVGIEDPYTNAHGVNESLHLEDFKKAIQAQIHLLNDLSQPIS